MLENPLERYFSARVYLFLLLVLVGLSFVDAQNTGWTYAASGTITTVTVSGDGKGVAAGTEDGLVYYFEVSSLGGGFKWRSSLSRPVTALAISSDAEYVVAASEDQALYLYDRNFTGSTYLWRYMASGIIKSLSISASGSRIVGGGTDSTLYLFDNAPRGVSPSKEKIIGAATVTAITPAGDFVAAGTESGYAYLINDPYMLNPSVRYFETGSPILSLAAPDDGRSIVVGTREGYVYLADAEAFQHQTFRWKFKTDGPVRSVGISGDDSSIVAGGDDGYVYLFPKALKDDTYSWRYDTGSPIASVGISASGDRVVAGSADGNIVLLGNQGSGYALIWSSNLGEAVVSLAISREGTSAVAGGAKGHILDFQLAEPVIETSAVTESRTPPSVSNEVPAMPLYTNFAVPAAVIAAIGLAVGVGLKRTRSRSANKIASTTITVDKPVEPKTITDDRAVVSRPTSDIKTIPSRTTTKDELIHGKTRQQQRLKTGYDDLDRLLGGGIPSGISLLITSPPCDERDLLLTRTLSSAAETARELFFISGRLDLARQILSRAAKVRLILTCPLTDTNLQNTDTAILPEGVENLSDLNIRISKAIEGPPTVTDGVIFIDVLSDILLYHDARTTRQWLSDLLPRLKQKGFTIVATLNPLMHSKEGAQTVIDLVDGHLDITERDLVFTVRVRKMFPFEYHDEELILDKRILRDL